MENGYKLLINVLDTSGIEEFTLLREICCSGPVAGKTRISVVFRCREGLTPEPYSESSPLFCGVSQCWEDSQNAEIWFRRGSGFGNRNRVWEGCAGIQSLESAQADSGFSHVYRLK